MTGTLAGKITKCRRVSDLGERLGGGGGRGIGGEEGWMGKLENRKNE